MRDAGLARSRHQRLTERFEGLGLLATEQTKRHRACARLARCHQNVDAFNRKGEHAHARAFEKDAPLHGVHEFLPCPKRCNERFFKILLKRVNDKEGGESSARRGKMAPKSIGGSPRGSARLLAATWWSPTKVESISPNYRPNVQRETITQGMPERVRALCPNKVTASGAWDFLAKSWLDRAFEVTTTFAQRASFDACDSRHILTVPVDGAPAAIVFGPGD